MCLEESFDTTFNVVMGGGEGVESTPPPRLYGTEIMFVHQIVNNTLVECKE